jgi:hypothetical protein
MKQNGNHKNTGQGQIARILRVEFIHTTAKAVAIAGSFNNWRPQASPMIAVGDGRWLKELALVPGAYEYLLVADGEWLPDPSIKDTVPNPFGGVNSFVTVASSPNGNGSRKKSKPGPG